MGPSGSFEISVDGMPVGGQVITKHYDEYGMFRVAYALERALGEEAHR